VVAERKETSVPAPDAVKPQQETEKSPKKSAPAVKAPKAELALLTLIGQREKLCRDDLTAMLLSGDESV
jgi:hypothetical protein